MLTLLQGDAEAVLRTLPAGSVHCCVTSPPYFGLRDYGTGTWSGGDPACDHEDRPRRNDAGRRDGRGVPYGPADKRDAAQFRGTCGKCGATRTDRQLGLEKSLRDYVARLVCVFGQVRRVLRDDGVMFLNLGDSYCNAGTRNNGTGLDGNRRGGMANTDGSWAEAKASHGDMRRALRSEGFKVKDRLGVPHRVVFALQKAGWYWRDEIVWSKASPMPESVTDRTTKAHEFVFVLTKRPRYFFDAEAVREDSAPSAVARAGLVKRPSPKQQVLIDNGTWKNGADEGLYGAGRNPRSVWHLASEPCPEAHFATFPSEIPRRAILAGTSEKGVCPGCGAPWRRVVERGQSHYAALGKSGRDAVAGDAKTPGGGGHTRMPNGTTPSYFAAPAATVGWEPGCACPPHDPIAATVLDPFSGAGTTGIAALKLGRRYIGIELNSEYIQLSRRRINAECGLLAYAAQGGIP